jgi:hypothetical protein
MSLHDIIEADLNVIMTTDEDDSACINALLDDTTPCKVLVQYGSFVQNFENFAADTATITARVSEVGQVDLRQKFTVNGKSWHVHSIASSDGHLISLFCISNKRLLPQNMA